VTLPPAARQSLRTLPRCSLPAGLLPRFLEVMESCLLGPDSPRMQTSAHACLVFCTASHRDYSLDTSMPQGSTRVPQFVRREGDMQIGCIQRHSDESKQPREKRQILFKNFCSGSSMSSSPCGATVQRSTPGAQRRQYLARRRRVPLGFSAGNAEPLRKPSNHQETPPKLHATHPVIPRHTPANTRQL